MRYKLKQGTQVREEDFGLLFYTMEGPRLYFIASGDILGSDFFKGGMTLGQWVGKEPRQGKATPSKILALREALNRLEEKGVILEC